MAAKRFTFLLYCLLCSLFAVPHIHASDHAENMISTNHNGILPNFSTPVEIVLPDVIYAVVGDKLQLFYRGMIKAPNPYIYDILVTCSKGAAFPRYWEYMPIIDDAGATTFKLEIKDKDGNLLGGKSCKLITVPPAVSPTNNINILCVGDSLTANAQWPAELCRRLSSDAGEPAGLGLRNISFVGRKSAKGIRHEGNGGWTWTSYSTAGIKAYRFQASGITDPPAIDTKYTNNGRIFNVLEINITDGAGNILCSALSGSQNKPEPSGKLTKMSGAGDPLIVYNDQAEESGNPFWSFAHNALDFPAYVAAYCNGAVDVVYFLLTWNGQKAWRTDFSKDMVDAKKLFDHIHDNHPACKIKLMGVQLPSLNGGMGANYGAAGGYSDTYGMVVTILNMNKAYQKFANEEQYAGFVEFVSVSEQFDSENNMPAKDVPVNSRSSKTEKRGTNGVHPATEGYHQIADVVFRNFIADFCAD